MWIDGGVGAIVGKALRWKPVGRPDLGSAFQRPLS